MRLSASVAVILLLVACTPSVTGPIPAEKALDGKYVTQKLGIAVRYPTTFIDATCKKPISVTIQEDASAVKFMGTPAYDEECNAISPATPRIFAAIDVMRVHDTNELRTFVDTVFSKDCIFDEMNEYDGVTRVFIRSKNPPTDEPDFACSETILWNRTANVALFSALGSKTGGGPDWPSAKPIVVSDGSEEHWFDFLIMDSIEYLPEK